MPFFVAFTLVATKARLRHYCHFDAVIIFAAALLPPLRYFHLPPEVEGSKGMLLLKLLTRFLSPYGVRRLYATSRLLAAAMICRAADATIRFRFSAMRHVAVLMLPQFRHSRHYATGAF